MCSWPHVLRRPYTNTKHWFFGVKPSTRLEQCSTRAEPPIEHFRLVGLWWEQPSGLFPTAVCLESPSKPGPVPSNGGAHFFLWIEWTTLSPSPLPLPLLSNRHTHGRLQEQLGGIKWHLFLYWLWPRARNSTPKTYAASSTHEQWYWLWLELPSHCGQDVND